MRGGNAACGEGGQALHVRYMREQHQNGKVHFGKELLGVLSVQPWDDSCVRERRPS